MLFGALIGCETVRYDHERAGDTFIAHGGGDARTPAPDGGDSTRGDVPPADGPTSDPAAGDLLTGDLHTGDEHTGDAHTGDTHMGDAPKCIANACGPCGCPGASPCHEESATCLMTTTDSCAPIELGARLGTFIFNTARFTDLIQSFACDDSTCGSVVTASPGAPEVVLSWQFPQANVDYELSAQSGAHPFSMVMMFPFGPDERCSGLTCCYEALTGPPYTFGTLVSSNAVGNRANLLLETQGGTPGEITVRICEGPCL